MIFFPHELDSFYDFLSKWNLDHVLRETHLLSLIFLRFSPSPEMQEEELLGNW